MIKTNICGNSAKIKTPFAKIFVSGTVDKPYYEILYLDTSDGTCHIGFGSYCVEYVFKWLSEEFEIIETEPSADVAPVVHGKWEDKPPVGRIKSTNIPVVQCSECGITFCDIINNHHYMYRYCPYCGAVMDAEVETNETD